MALLCAVAPATGAKPTGVLNGIVLLERSGKGVAAAQVRLVNTTYAAFTAADGSFTLADVPAGEYRLQLESSIAGRPRAVACAVKSGTETYAKLLIRENGEVSASFVDSDLPSARIAGIVYSPAGHTPVAGARVRLSGSGQEAVTGEDGRYEFGNVGAGLYSISALVDGCPLTTLNDIAVSAGSELNLDIVGGLSERPRRARGDDNEATGTIVGQVSGASGAPLSAVRIDVRNLGAVTFSDRHGFFRLPNLIPACYVLTFSAGGARPATASGVAVVPHQITRVDVRIPEQGEATAEVRLTPWSGAALRLTVLDGEGRPVENALLSLGNDSIVATSDSAGVMLAADLPAGRYAGLVLSDDYADFVLREVLLYEGRVSEDTVRLSRPQSAGAGLARLEGVVFDSAGLAPIAGVAIAVDSAGIAALTDSSGAFALTDLPPGTYTMRLSAQGWNDAVVGPITLSADTVARLRLRLSPAPLRDVGVAPGQPALRITGRIVDERGRGVTGARAALEGTTAAAVAGRDGEFALGAVTPGRYTLVSSAQGFAPGRLAVESRGDTAVEVRVRLETDNVRDLGRETVTAAIAANTAAGMLLERRQTINVADAVAAAEFSRAGATSVADAMKQVPGVTLLDGKYVAIRGLSDRYINTTLNGMLLPSPDPDKRAVPLDMFPTALLDNIVTNKSFTPDKPGDFAGGNVDIRTSAIPDRFTLGVSLSGALDAAVFSDSSFLTSEGGKTGWLGIDDGTRAMPEIVENTRQFPVQTVARTDPAQAHLLDELSRSFRTGFIPQRDNKNPDWGLGLMASNRFNLFRRPLGVLLSFTYANKSAAYSDGTNNRYEYQQVATSGDYNELGYLRAFTEDRSTRDILWGGLGAVTFEPARHHIVGLNYLYVHNAEDDVKHASGFKDNLEAGRIVEYYSMQYSERNLSTWQLYGRHRLPLRLSFDWRFARATTSQDQPDQRTFMFHHLIVPDEELGYDYSAHENILPVKHPERVFRTLEEESYQVAGDLTLRPLGHDDSRLLAQFGATLFAKERRYRVRRFTFEPNRTGATSLNDAGGPEHYFDESNLGITSTRVRGADTTFIFGLYLNELNVESVNYDAARSAPAVYLLGSADPFRWLSVTGGVRYENATLDLENLADTKAHQEYRDWLPAASLKFGLPRDMQVRLSYAKTLARPTERELEPPPGSFDPSENVAFMGNPDLVQTTIHNTDLRWEWYAKTADIVSVSLFHKHMIRPIERTVVDNNGTISYRNVPQATILGAELEVRYSFERLHPRLEPLSAGGNIALISSKLTIDTSEYRMRREFDPTTKTTRQLQGQSPWVINAYVAFASRRLGLSASATFNILGRTIATVSAGNAPDIYTEPHPNLGVSLGQKIGKGFAIETVVRNIFGDSRKAVSTFRGTEYVNIDQHRGRSYGLKLSYKFR